MIPHRLQSHILFAILFLLFVAWTARAQSPTGKEFVVVLPTLMDIGEMNRDVAKFDIEVMAQQTTNVSLMWADGTPIINAQIQAGLRTLFTKPMFELWQIMQSPFDFDAEKPNRRAFLITADHPVTVQAIFDTAYRAENFQVFPVSSYDTSYTLVNYAGYALSQDRNGFIVIASDDNTNVRITPKVQTWAGHMPATEYTVHLDRYQVYQVVSTFKSGGPTADMTGTLIRADKPVGVLSFSAGANVPTHGPPGPPPNPPGSGNAQEYSYSTKVMLEHQVPESYAGTQFYTMPFFRNDPSVVQRVNRKAGPPGRSPFRRDTSRLRFVTLQYGTMFDTNGVRIKNLAGNDSIFPTNSYLDIPFTGTMSVTASKPVVGMQFAYSGRDGMTYDSIVNIGTQIDTINIPYGNPSMAYLPPVSQYRRNLQISVPNIQDRPPAPDIFAPGMTLFWRHYLIITAPVSALGKVKVNGLPVNLGYNQSDHRYVTGYLRVYPGQRELIESPDPISVLSYGLTWYDSYATTAGEAARSFAVAAPDTLRFFSCDAQKDTAIDLSNTGSGDFTLDSIHVNGLAATLTYPTPLPYTFVGNSKEKLLLTFKTPQPGTYTGSIKLYTDANNRAVLEVPFVITRDSAKLGLPATTIDFGVLKSTQTQRDTFIVVQNNGVRPLVISAVNFTGTGYQLIGASFPDTLAPAGYDTLHLQFTPGTNGLHEGTMRIIGTPCLQSVDVTLRGFKGSGANVLVQRSLHYPAFLCAAPAQVDSVIMMRSVGDEPIVIGTATISGVNANEFSLLDSLSGKTVLPGDTLSFRVRFTPGGFGDRRAGLAITTNAKNGTRIDIDLVARRDTVTLTPLADTIHLGRVLSCNAYVDGTISVRNTGTIPDTITSADPGSSSAYTITTPLPVVVNPFTSQELTIRFTGVADGIYPATIHLHGVPCDVEAQVWVDAERTSPALSGGARAFDTLYPCQPASVYPVVLRNTGSVPDTIASYANTGSTAFSVQGVTFPLVLAPGDADTIHLSFDPKTPGYHTGTLQFLYQPCNSTADFQLTGFAAFVNVELSTTNIDFGSVNVGSSGHGTITLRNTGNQPTFITGIDPENGNAVKVISPGQLPYLLQPNDSVVVELEYDPTARGTLSSQLHVTMSNPCSPDTTVALNGVAAGEETIQTSLTVVAPQVEGNVGTQVEIPISVENWINVDRAGATALVVRLRHLYRCASTVSVGASLAGASAAIVDEHLDGRDRVLTLRVSGGTFPANGELMRLRSLVLLGDTDRAPLILDSAWIETPPNRAVTITRRNGELHTLGICTTGGNRFVRLGGLLLKSVAPNPFHDHVAVEFENEQDDAVTIRLYDASGNCMEVFDQGHITAGVHRVEIDGRKLPSGVYICEIDNGRVRVRATMILAQ
ncbi:MAG TPA: choice-of-anchor D domain-containing protein [Candidatus Kapabacteria bacterium]|nr:choice-of-anchor D domain-containing protein [Candidatus Kapabacteria bacterium]